MGTEWFFGHYIDPESLGGKAVALLLAVLCSGAIGLERQLHGTAAGMRTHIMVCVGSAVITMTSVEIGLGVRGGMRGDPGHIAAQIVSGVGFLGAGAIMREGLSVRGLTTAASIWTTAGIGIALGASPKLGELAVLATIIVLATLAVVARFEAVLKLKKSITTIHVEVEDVDRGAARILDRLSSHGIVVYGILSEPGATSRNNKSMEVTRQMRMQVLLPKGFNRNDFNTWMLEEKGVLGFHLE